FSRSCDLISCTYSVLSYLSVFFFIDPATTAIYTLSLHDALPIYLLLDLGNRLGRVKPLRAGLRAVHDGVATIEAERILKIVKARSEEHTSELQSRENLVCRLLLEKKKMGWTVYIILFNVVQRSI